MWSRWRLAGAAAAASRRTKSGMTEAPLLSFDAFIRHWAAEKPGEVALEEGDEAATFAELDRRTRHAVALLAELGVTKGDRVAWLGKNAKLYFELFYACGRIGVVMVPIGWRLAAPEVRYILQDTARKCCLWARAARIQQRKPMRPGRCAADRNRVRGMAADGMAEPAELPPQDLTTRCSSSIPAAPLATPRARCFPTAISSHSGAAADAGEPWSRWEEGERFWSPCPARISAAPGSASWRWRGGARDRPARVHARRVLSAFEQG